MLVMWKTGPCTYIYICPWLDTESSVRDLKSSNSTQWRQDTGPLCQRAFTLRLKTMILRLYKLVRLVFTIRRSGFIKNEVYLTTEDTKAGLLSPLSRLGNTLFVAAGYFSEKSRHTSMDRCRNCATRLICRVNMVLNVHRNPKVY